MKKTSADTLLSEQKNGLIDLVGAVANPSNWLQDALSVEREEGFVKVDEVNIHYFRWGDPSKPGIIMLHGFLAHARCFAFIAPFLAADFHVVAYDFSGMGDSGKRDSYPMDVRINELLGVVEHTGLANNGEMPTIIAHSYGGHVGVAALSAHPNKFSGIIICDLMILRPHIIEKNRGLLKPPGNQNAERKNRIYPDYQTAKARFVLSPPQAVEQSELFDFMAFHSLKKVEGGWSWKFDPSVFKREAGVEKNVLSTAQRVVSAPGSKAIIYGQESLLFNDDSADYVRETIEELESSSFPIIGIPNARHHLMLDQPMALLTSLKTILALWQAK